MIHSTLFHYNIDEMLQALNSCLCKLAYGKICFVTHHFAKSHSDIKCGLTVIFKNMLITMKMGVTNIFASHNIFYCEILSFTNNSLY